MAQKVSSWAASADEQERQLTAKVTVYDILGLRTYVFNLKCLQTRVLLF